MTLRIDKNGLEYKQTSLYLRSDVYHQAKAEKIPFGKTLEEALEQKIGGRMQDGITV